MQAPRADCLFTAVRAGRIRRRVHRAHHPVAGCNWCHWGGDRMRPSVIAIRCSPRHRRFWGRPEGMARPRQRLQAAEDGLDAVSARAHRLDDASFDALIRVRHGVQGASDGKLTPAPFRRTLGDKTYRF